MSVKTKLPERSVFTLGQAVARVGDEVITLHELKRAVIVQRKGMPAGQLSPADNYMLAKSVLKEMVDRAMVLQEAKREIKNPKQLDLFMKQADKIWSDEELPPLLRQTSSANVYELKQKLAERDESLDEIRESFRREFLFRGFLEHKIGPKLKVELPEMRAYYAAHLNDFDRPAQVSWREVIVEVQKHPSRVAARAKADAVLARLRRGEDFGAVAKAESDGPNKSGGGSWQTTPGSYGVPAVNSALESLPVGQVSTVLEGPTSYHVVLVEARRPAGPASFFEVQDKVYKAIRAQKIAKESNAFLDRLRRQTIVTTEFDDPGVTRTSAELRNAVPRRAAPASVR
jgi:peptidyl-prolyl cis-trans isomerase SurA